MFEEAAERGVVFFFPPFYLKVSVVGYCLAILDNANKVWGSKRVALSS